MKRASLKQYRLFMQEGMGQGHVPRYSGGGLVRSLDGWSYVISLRRKG